MLPYTAGDGLQIIAREYGIVAKSPKESEAASAKNLRSFWDRAGAVALPPEGGLAAEFSPRSHLSFSTLLQHIEI